MFLAYMGLSENGKFQKMAIKCRDFWGHEARWPFWANFFDVIKTIIANFPFGDQTWQWTFHHWFNIFPTERNLNLLAIILTMISHYGIFTIH